MKRKKNAFKNKKNESKDIIPQNDFDNEYENEPINVIHKNKPDKKKQCCLFKTNCCRNLILTFLLISFLLSLIIYLIMYLKLNNSIESIKTQYQYKNINLSPLHNSNLNDKKANVIDENNNKEVRKN